MPVKHTVLIHAITLQIPTLNSLGSRLLHGDAPDSSFSLSSLINESMLFVFSIKAFKSCTATVTVLGEGPFFVRLLRKEEMPFGVLGVEVMLDVGVEVTERSKGLLLHDCGDNPPFVILLLRRMFLPLSDIGHIL